MRSKASGRRFDWHYICYENVVREFDQNECASFEEDSINLFLSIAMEQSLKDLRAEAGWTLAGAQKTSTVSYRGLNKDNATALNRPALLEAHQRA